MKKLSHFFLISCLLLFVICFLLACAQRPVEPLRLGSNVWPGYEPLYLARHQQYLDSHKIRLVEYSSASQVIQAFRHHVIDAAALTLDESLLLLQSGEDISIVLVLDESAGGDAIVAKPQYESIAALKGKRVGVENNALGAYVLSRALELNQLSIADVVVVPLDISQHYQAFTHGSVDAIVTFEPVRTRAVDAGGQVVFNSQQIPGEILDVLVVRNDYLTQHLPVVQHLVDSWFMALRLIEREPVGSADILRRRMGLSIEQTLASYQGLKFPNVYQNQQYLQTNHVQLLDSLIQLSDVMKQKGLIDRNLPVAKLLPVSPLVYR